MKKTVLAIVFLSGFISALSAQAPAPAKTSDEYLLKPGDLLVSGELVAGWHGTLFGIGPGVAAEYEVASLNLTDDLRVVLGAGGKLQMRFGTHVIGQLAALGGAHFSVGQFTKSEALGVFDLSLRLGPAFSYNFTGLGFHVGPDLILGTSWYFKPELAATFELDWLVGTSFGVGLGLIYRL